MLLDGEGPATEDKYQGQGTGGGYGGGGYRSNDGDGLQGLVAIFFS